MIIKVTAMLPLAKRLSKQKHYEELEQTDLGFNLKERGQAYLKYCNKFNRG